MSEVIWILVKDERRKTIRGAQSRFQVISRITRPQETRFLILQGIRSDRSRRSLHFPPVWWEGECSRIQKVAGRVGWLVLSSSRVLCGGKNCAKSFKPVSGYGSSRQQRETAHYSFKSSEEAHYCAGNRHTFPVKTQILVGGRCGENEGESAYPRTSSCSC